MLLHVTLGHHQVGVAHLVVTSDRRQFEQVVQLRNRRKYYFRHFEISPFSAKNRINWPDLTP